MATQSELWALYDQLGGEAAHARTMSREDKSASNRHYWAGKRIGMEDAQYGLSKLLNERPAETEEGGAQ